MPSNKEKLTSHEIRTSEPNNEVGHVKELKSNDVLPNGETRRRSIRKIKRTEKIEEAAKTPQFKVKHDNYKSYTTSYSNLLCCIENCNQSRSNEISLFGLPSNQVLREIWITKCNIPTEKIKPTTKICGKHFEKHMFKNPIKNCRLIPNAVPTLFHNIDESKITRLSEDTKHTDNNFPNTTLNDKFVSVLKTVHSGETKCFPADNTNSTEHLIDKVTDETVNKTSTSSHYKSTSLEQINKKTEDFPSVLSLSNINGKQQTILVESTNAINSINMIIPAENPIEEPNGNVIDAVNLSSENTMSVYIPPQPNINEPMLPIKSTKKSIELTNSIDVTKPNGNTSEGSMSKVTVVTVSTSSLNSPIVLAKQINKKIESSVITYKTNIDGKKSILQNECTGKSIEVVNPIDVTKSNEYLTKGLNGTVINVAPSTLLSNCSAVPSKQTNKNQQMLPIKSEPSTESINSSNFFDLNENSANILHKSTTKFTEKSNNNLGTNVCFQNVCNSVTMSVESNNQQTKKVEVDLYRISKPSLEIIPVKLPTTNYKRIENKRTISPELPTKRRKLSSDVIDLTENPQLPSKISKPVCLFYDSCISNSASTQFQELNSRHLSDSSPTKPLLKTEEKEEGINIKIVNAITSYKNVQEIHYGHSEVRLPDISWKAVHFPNLSVTMFFDNIMKKKVVFQNSDNLVPKITIQDKPYSYSKQIKSKRELEKLLVKICCRVEVCHGYYENMHPLCIGYFETISDERCHHCQELVKPYMGTNNQSIRDLFDNVNLMNIKNESMRNQKPSAVQELKRFVLRYSENEIQTALETVFGNI